MTEEEKQRLVEIARDFIRMCDVALADKIITSAQHLEFTELKKKFLEDVHEM